MLGLPQILFWSFYVCDELWRREEETVVCHFMNGNEKKIENVLKGLKTVRTILLVAFV